MLVDLREIHPEFFWCKSCYIYANSNIQPAFVNLVRLQLILKYKPVPFALFRKVRLIFLFLFVLLITLQVSGQVRRIAVIGSSTARGTGASVPDSGWVRQLSRTYKCRMDIVDTVYNLASSGTTFYHGMPNEYSPPPNRPDPLPANNVSRAMQLLSSLPNHSNGLIIVNYPTGGYDTYSIEEIMTGLQIIFDTATHAGYRCLITTTQPRTDAAYNTPDIRKKLADIKDSILLRFGAQHSVNFYDGLVNAADSSILPACAAGDNIHFNDAGHRILSERVIDNNPFDFRVWYSKPTGYLNFQSNWGCQPDGSGSCPGSFTADNQTFIITNNPEPAVIADWILEGKNTRVILGKEGENIQLTIPENVQVIFRSTTVSGCP